MSPAYLGLLSAGGLSLALLGCGGGGGPDSGAPAAADDAGAGSGLVGVCPAQTQLAMAVKIALQPSWAGTVALAGGPGPVTIWLLVTFKVDPSSLLDGTARTCGYQTPAFPLSLTAATLLDAGPSEQFQMAFSPSTWDAKDMPAAPMVGNLAGWNVGDAIKIPPTTMAYGLAPSSTYADPMTPWPQDVTQIMSADIVDGDDDGHPGITALPRADGSFVLPPVGLGGDSAQVDQLYLVLRTELALYGTNKSCSEQTGVVAVSQLDSHVIGCRQVDTMGDCMPSGWEFLDADFDQVPTVTSGTFDAVELSADGSAPTCADVLAQTFGN